MWSPKHHNTTEGKKKKKRENSSFLSGNNGAKYHPIAYSSSKVRMLVCIDFNWNNYNIWNWQVLLPQL